MSIFDEKAVGVFCGPENWSITHNHALGNGN